MRLRPGGEGGDLLVPDMDPFDLALTAKGIGQAVQAVADDPVNPLDAGGREGLGKLVGNGLRHRALSPMDDCRKPRTL